ncbi:ferredoxin [Microbacterium sp. zg.B48]|uniref:ferredoxin n=1 Tax=Microbacterium sp. zg.B48 TaxID=2969408 RepID=UPI00214B4DC8|nr:ferredoxin [Microbacterium sp. zg.B48]MCR2764340.1 ferredoxin [Microbacterium sp. zg.B48]
MKLTLNAELCEGFGACARHLPEVFELDEWGYAVLLADGVVPQGKENLARRAMDDCPVLAITRAAGEEN